MSNVASRCVTRRKVPCPARGAVAHLCENGQAITLSSRETLHPISQEGPAAFVLCSGAALASRTDKGGRHLATRLLFPGSCLGWPSTVLERDPAWSIDALSPVRGLLVPYSVVQNAQAGSLEQRSSVLHAVATEAEESASQCAEQGNGTVRQRLVRVLLRLARHSGLPDSRGLFIPILPPQLALARMLGCRAETLSRVYSQLRDDGLCHRVSRGLILPAPDDLMKETNRQIA